MKKVIISLILIFFISSNTILYAAEAESEHTAHDKFSRGIFNIITFPFEIPVNIYKASVEENPLMGLLYGLPLGIGKSIIRLFAGIVEISTSPLPPYEPIIEPEFLLFKKEKTD